jgi:hypothetical protein
VADRVVLDTSAFLTLTGREAGAQQVEECISDAMDGRTDLHSSFVCFTELEYISIQEEGQAIADQRLADVKALILITRGYRELSSWRADAVKASTLFRWLRINKLKMTGR